MLPVEQEIFDALILAKMGYPDRIDFEQMLFLAHICEQDGMTELAEAAYHCADRAFGVEE